MPGHNYLNIYDVSTYPAAGNCFQKTRYPAVRNFDQFSRNSCKWVPARRLFSSSSLHVSSTISSSTVKTAEPPPPLLTPFLFISVQLTSVSLISAKIFQNWSTLAGFEESVGGFKPIKFFFNVWYKPIVIWTKFSKSIVSYFHQSCPRSYAKWWRNLAASCGWRIQARGTMG